MSQVAREDGEGLGVTGRGGLLREFITGRSEEPHGGFYEPCMGESEVADIPCGGPVAIEEDCKKRLAGGSELIFSPMTRWQGVFLETICSTALSPPDL